MDSAAIDRNGPDPRFAPPWTVLRARALDAIAGRRWAEALHGLGEALVSAPRRELAELYALRAHVRLMSEDPAKGIDDADACLADDPFHAEGRWWRGAARAQLGRWDAAIADLSTVADLPGPQQRAVREWLERTVAQACEAWRSRIRETPPTALDFAARAGWYLAIDDRVRAERDASEARRLGPDLPSTHEIDARTARRRGALGDALIAARRWSEAAPDSLEPFRLIAELETEAGRRSAALAAAERVEQGSGSSLAERSELVRLWRSVGDRLRALTWCDRSQEEHGQLYPILEYRGRLLMDLRCWRSAAEQYRQLLRLRPDSLVDRVQLGRCLVKLRRFDEAARCFEEGSLLGPTSADLHSGLALARWSARDPVAARTAIDRALRLDTTHLPGRVLMAHLEMSAGRVDGAIRMLRQAWERGIQERSADDEWLGECAYTEGVALTERGEPERAIERFDAALARRPDHPGTLIWRARSWARLGRFDRCRDDLAAATRLNPSCREQYRRLGAELAQDRLMAERVRPVGEAEEPATRFQRIVAHELSGDLSGARRMSAEVDADVHDSTGSSTSSPSEPATWDWALLQLRLARGLTDGSPRRWLREVLRDELTETQVTAVIDSLDPSVWRGPSLAWLEVQARRFPDAGRLAHHVGMAYHREGRAKRAARWFAQALALGHVEAETLACCGRQLSATGDPEGADRRLTMALERHPNQPTWLAWRGEARLKRERYDEALADFELALTIDPRQVAAYCGRAMVMARRGEWEPALQWLTKAFHRFDAPVDRARLLECRGRLYFNMKRFRRAIDDWDWAIGRTEDRDELADLLFMRGVAWFHQGDMARMRQDLERAQLAQAKHRGAAVVLDWLDNRVERFPKQLAPPRRQILPTRPAAGQTWSFAEPVQDEPEFPLDQWIVRKSDDREYGPLSRRTLLDWTREGRVEPTDWVLRADWNRWRRASTAWALLARPKRASDDRFVGVRPKDAGSSDAGIEDRSRFDAVAPVSLGLEELAGPPSIEASTLSQVDVGLIDVAGDEGGLRERRERGFGPVDSD
ncbi:MAG TPA: hypothetical protein DCQ98_01835 [Planctomycetaceae bacterium]|nr:hypothetical protein [Planctomycetaceae bacterium]